MSNTTFYFVIGESVVQKLGKPRFISSTKEWSRLWHLSRYADKVYKEGTKGGVKIVKDRTSNRYGYVTHNVQEMKEFMWAKLAAVPEELW